MVDFIVDVFAEIADFFIGLWSDKAINRFAAKKRGKKQGSQRRKK